MSGRARSWACLWALCGACLWGSGVAQAQEPSSAQAVSLGRAEAQVGKTRYTVSVYVAEDSLGPGKGVKQRTYVELLRGGRGEVLQRLRLPSAVAPDIKLTLALVDLGPGRQVLRVELAPPPSKAQERPTFEAWVQVGGDHPILWSGERDPLEPGRHLDVTDVDGDGQQEIVQGWSDASVTFCGRQTARLFPRVWNFKEGRFVEGVRRARVDPQTPVSRGVLETEAPHGSHFPGLVQFRSASSDVRDKAEALVRRPTALADGDYSTGWVEGAAGWGLGEFVTADVSEAYPLRGVRLFPGALSGAKEYAAYGVPTKVLLSFSDGTDLVAELPAEPRDAILEGGGFWVAFPKPVQTRCLTLTLLEVQPSKSSRDPRAALSEVAPLTDLDWADRQTALRRLVQDLATEPSRPRQAALSKLASNLGPELGSTIVAEIEREFSTEGGRPDLERLLPLLALAPLSDTRVILARVLSWPDLNQRELSSLQRALTFRGQGYWDVLRDLALAESPSPHLRARAARLFGRAAPKARLADLLPLLGKGDDELRQATVQALGRGELGISADLVREAAAAPNSPRCHDALWALDRVLRFHARGEPFELEGGERLFQIYNESEDIQIRLRAISLLDRVMVTSADTFLITVLESQERPEVRALAARALRRHPGPKSAESLGRTLKDPSPTLRFEALDALGPQVNLPTVIADLTTYARREGWRQGLVKAYGLLARSEQREGADYLYDIISGGDEQRAEFALAALRDARNNVRALPLIRVVDDAGRSERQRLLALEALSASPDPDAERVLVEAMGGGLDLPPEARAKAARALGARRTPGALAALRQQVQDPADPAVQRACIRALSNFRSRDALAALVALRGKLDPRSTRVLEDAIAALQESLDR